MFSTVVDGAPGLDAEYWAANVRRPVRFHQAVSAAAAEYGTFVEVSPNPILTHAVSETLAPGDQAPGDQTHVHHHALGTLVRDGDDAVSFHTNLNATHVSRPPSTPHGPEPHIALPATPWHHTHHWNPRRWHGRSDRAAGGVRASGPSVVPADWVCEMYWPASPLGDAPTDAADGTWLVVAGGALGAEIDRRLGSDVAVTVVDPVELEANPVIPDLAGVTHVLYAPEPTDSCDTAAGARIFTVARKLAAAMTERPLPPTLVMLTRNAAPVEAGDRANPAHAVLWGLGRTLALEHPEIWGRVIDVDESVPAQLAASWVLAEAHGGGAEDQVLYRAGQRRVARLRHTAMPTEPVRLNPDGSHLVVGATGNIGPHLISYLADQGATTIVAISRNPGSRLDALTQTLSGRGVRLLTVAVDATDPASLSALFDRFGADLPPLSGIYLAAFGGGMVTLQDMTDDDVAAMFGPKLDAAWLLHTLSSTHAIEQFVMFASISGLIGSRWLGHYTATTTFLDALAYARRAAGLPATAVDWGWWKSLADSESESERQITEETGLLPMADEVAIRALSVLTAPHAPVCCAVVAADWNRLAAAYRTRAPLHIIDELVIQTATETHSGSLTEFRTALAQCDPTLRRQMLTEHVGEQVAGAMGLASPQELEHSVGFFQSGMTSLMAVALRRALSDSLGEELPASVLFDYPTVEELVGYLAARLPETAVVVEDGSDDDYGDLAEDELLRQLSERLR
jgi:phthiocerol/phenolphthiocerol synthesis type-I polyketide synthase B